MVESTASPDQLLEQVVQLSSTSNSPASSIAQIHSLLDEIKILSRSPLSAKDLSTSDALTKLSQFAFLAPRTNVSISAQKTALATLANVCLHVPEARATIVSVHDDPVKQCLELLEHDDVELNFLSARLLFFMSTSTLIPSLLTAPETQVILQKVLQNFVDVYNSSTWTNFHTLALTDLLKLLFSITQAQSPSHSGEAKDTLTPFIASLVSLILKLNASNPPNFTRYAFNALMTVLELTPDSDEVANSVFQSSSPTTFTKHVIAILSTTLQQTPPSEIETRTLGLFSCLRIFYARGPPSIRTLMKSQLLPSDSERNLPLGRSHSLPSSILNLTKNPSSLRDVVSELLFELSDRDASTFVHNVGYGFAAGYLVNHGIGVPIDINAASDGPLAVNPITGQRVDMQERIDPFKDMTDEEKEREAERLFVLFERLEATGVMGVENPVRRAAREGRLQ